MDVMDTLFRDLVAIIGGIVISILLCASVVLGAVYIGQTITQKERTKQVERFSQAIEHVADQMFKTKE